jgi:hypothetical protein
VTVFIRKRFNGVQKEGRVNPFSRARSLSENVHLLRYTHPSSLQRTHKYASFLRIACKQVSETACAVHINIFQQPPYKWYSDRLLGRSYFIDDLCG